jgi:tetratricopeptide (TPR) repeat protein
MAFKINDSVYTSRMALFGEQATYEWNWTAIARAGHGHPFYRDYLRATGQIDRLIDLMTGLQRDDPDSIFWGFYLGDALYLDRQYDAAIARFTQTIERDPTFLWSRLGLAKAYLQQAHYTEALAELNAAQPLRRTPGWLGYAYARMGQREKALRVLADLNERSAREYVSPVVIAWVYLGLGDTAQTFAWMRKACDTRVAILNEIKVEPAYDPIRADPRFADLLQCVGVDDQALARIESARERDATSN